MDGVEHGVEGNPRAINGYRKVVFVDRISFAIVVHIMPPVFEDVNGIAVVGALVQVLMDHASALERNLVFAGITAHHNGNVFHLKVCRF